ncbi:MAG: hypothetical protein V1818_01900 [Candidatus Aenigmatarchaeota archaeon]
MDNLRRRIDPCTSKQKGECVIFGVDGNCNNCDIYQSRLWSKVIGSLSPYKSANETVIEGLVV